MVINSSPVLHNLTLIAQVHGVRYVMFCCVSASPRGRKTTCPISREQFLKKAPNLKMTLDLGKAGSQELLGVYAKEE